MNLLSRRDLVRDFLLVSLWASPLIAQSSADSLVVRQQVGGEWCFLMLPQNWLNGDVVIILHGAGEWVDGATSSWEGQPGALQIIQRLLRAGFAVAQSNGAARHFNGMWGNDATQAATVALMDWIKTRHRVRRFHALAMSAGNLVLLNLLLSKRAEFAAAVMLAPCLSLASEYRCPGGIDRVSTIAEAYRFTPASKCPGDPMADHAFLEATEGFDPIRRLERLSDEQVRSALNATRLMAIYESNDPRVPPAENILVFSQRLLQAGVPLRLTRMEADTHGSQELFVRYASQIIQFF